MDKLEAEKRLALVSVYIVSRKKTQHQTALIYFCQILTDIHNSFAGAFYRIFATNQSQKGPLYLKDVAMLLCEIFALFICSECSCHISC